MKVLVTGAKGFIGKNLVSTLDREDKYEIICIDRENSKEEFVKAEDCGNYYRIPCDNRDLNYNKYFTEGNNMIRNQVEYNSDNTNRIDIEGVKKLLLKLPFIQQELDKFNNTTAVKVEELV